MPTFKGPIKKPFENVVGKGKNAGNKHFHLVPQHSLPYQIKIASFVPHLNYCLVSIWSHPHFCCLIKSKIDSCRTLWSSRDLNHSDRSKFPHLLLFIDFLNCV